MREFDETSETLKKINSDRKREMQAKGRSLKKEPVKVEILTIDLPTLSTEQTIVRKR